MKLMIVVHAFEIESCEVHSCSPVGVHKSNSLNYRAGRHFIFRCLMFRKLMMNSLVFLLTFYVAAIVPQIGGTIVDLDGLVCSDRQCTPADNSSVPRILAYIKCVVGHHTDFLSQQCNYQHQDEYRFPCALKEDGTFCSELINYHTEIPPACNEVSTCTHDCKAALIAKFGCCIHLNAPQRFSPGRGTNPELQKLQKKCTFDVTSTCQLAIPEPPSVVPVAQIECPSFSAYSESLLCENFPSYTQEIVNMLTGNGCSSLKSAGIGYYAFCDQSSGQEYCYLDYVPTLSNLTQDCINSSVYCTPECRESLVELKETFGCCANSHLLFYSVAMTTQFTSIYEHFYSCEENRDIWSHCGVASPGFCDNPLVLNGGLLSVAQALVVVTSAFIAVVWWI